MATGVLVLGVGRATRLLTFLVGCDKDTRRRSGSAQATVTDDAEGEVTASAARRDGDRAGCRRAAVAALTGDIAAGPERGQRDQGRRASGPTAGARGRGGRPAGAPGHGAPVRRARRAGLDVDGTPVLDVDVEVDGVLRHLRPGPRPRPRRRPRRRRPPHRAAPHAGRRLRARRRARRSTTSRPDRASGCRSRPLAQAARAAFACARSTRRRHAPRLRPAAAVGASRAHRTGGGDRAGRPLVAMLDESRPTARSLVVFSPSTS